MKDTDLWALANCTKTISLSIADIGKMESLMDGVKCIWIIATELKTIAEDGAKDMPAE